MLSCTQKLDLMRHTVCIQVLASLRNFSGRIFGGCVERQGSISETSTTHEWNFVLKCRDMTKVRRNAAAVMLIKSFNIKRKTIAYPWAASLSLESSAKDTRSNTSSRDQTLSCSRRCIFVTCRIYGEFELAPWMIDVISIAQESPQFPSDWELK